MYQGNNSKPPSCKSHVDIPGSNKWVSCKYKGMTTVGKFCQCKEKYQVDLTGNCELCNPPTPAPTPAPTPRPTVPLTYECCCRNSACRDGVSSGDDGNLAVNHNKSNETSARCCKNFEYKCQTPMLHPRYTERHEISMCADPCEAARTELGCFKAESCFWTGSLCKTLKARAAKSGWHKAGGMVMPANPRAGAKEMPCNHSVNISGSDKWLSCYGLHMKKSGKFCQCNEGYQLDANGRCTGCPDCKPKRVFTNINSWYPNRTANNLDCVRLCRTSSAVKKWCRYINFESGTESGTCMMYDCKPDQNTFSKALGNVMGQGLSGVSNVMKILPGKAIFKAFKKAAMGMVVDPLLSIIPNETKKDILKGAAKLGKAGLQNDIARNMMTGVLKGKKEMDGKIQKGVEELNKTCSTCVDIGGAYVNALDNVTGTIKKVGKGLRTSRKNRPAAQTTGHDLGDEENQTSSTNNTGHDLAGEE